MSLRTAWSVVSSAHNLHCWPSPFNILYLAYWIPLISLLQKFYWMFIGLACFLSPGVCLNATFISESFPDSATSSVAFYYLIFLHNIFFLWPTIYFAYLLFCLSLPPGYKLLKGRNFCLFVYCCYFHYFWSLGDSRVSINICSMSTCTISLPYKLCYF